MNATIIKKVVSFKHALIYLIKQIIFSFPLRIRKNPLVLFVLSSAIAKLIITLRHSRNLTSFQLFVGENFKLKLLLLNNLDSKPVIVEVEWSFKNLAGEDFEMSKRSS